ncbi:MAG TPA: hypothetical protein VLM75_11710 [Spirochaetota bacterium]|nr:hypothetical protein [Spirochaetota bacterium]
MKNGITFSGFVFVCAVALLLPGPGALFAESVFLKDGSIVEGNIAKETDTEIQITLKTKEQRSLPRRDVLRTVYHDEYRQLRYIHLLNGDVLEGYIVDEDRESYTYRKDLASNKENRVAKTKVDFVSKNRVAARAGKDGAEKREEKVAPAGSRQEGIVSRAAKLRAGYGFGTDLGFEQWDNKDIFNLDYFPSSYRNSRANGFDMLARIKMHKLQQYDSAIGDADFHNWIGESLLPATSTINEIEMTHLGVGLGGRAVYGWYIFGVLWQGYTSALIQYSSVDLWCKYQDVGISYSRSISKNAVGVVSAIGIELGLTKYIGVYVEGNIGYVPVFHSNQNLEEPSLLFGAVWRMSYL